MSGPCYLARSGGTFHLPAAGEEPIMAETHKIALSPDMVARVTKRRGGKLHAIERLDPARTALIVIDMQNVWVKPGMPAYTPTCEGIVANINRLAAGTRRPRRPGRGGDVPAWVRGRRATDLAAGIIARSNANIVCEPTARAAFMLNGRHLVVSDTTAT